MEEFLLILGIWFFLSFFGVLGFLVMLKQRPRINTRGSRLRRFLKISDSFREL